MTDHKTEVKKLLEPLFSLYHKELLPASVEQFVKFHRQTLKLDVPDTVVDELTNFYKVTNGVPNLDRFIFHCCGDKKLFEWWSEKGELWLGSRENDVLRWKNDRFCLGDTNSISYSAEYEFSTLSGLLEKSFEKWCDPCKAIHEINN
jgi:hypothetical protein